MNGTAQRVQSTGMAGNRNPGLPPALFYLESGHLDRIDLPRTPCNVELCLVVWLAFTKAPCHEGAFSNCLRGTHSSMLMHAHACMHAWSHHGFMDCGISLILPVRADQGRCSSVVAPPLQYFPSIALPSPLPRNPFCSNRQELHAILTST